MAKVAEGLRKNPVWKEAYAIAEYMYSKIAENFTNFPDEKFNTERKLRNSANDVIFYVSEAIGSLLSDTSEFDWNYARKSLFATQTMYSFACRQNIIELDPIIMVRMDKLLEKIDIEIEKTKKVKAEREKEDLEPWLEKYRLWKLMEDKPKP